MESELRVRRETLAEGRLVICNFKFVISVSLNYKIANHQLQITNGIKVDQLRRHRDPAVRTPSRDRSALASLHRPAQARHRAAELQRRPQAIERVEARSHPDGLVRRVERKPRLDS